MYQTDTRSKSAPFPADLTLLVRDFQAAPAFTHLVQRGEAAIAETATRLHAINDGYTALTGHNPIRHLESRLKTPESTVQKLLRRELPVNPLSALASLTDIAGVRVITDFIDDVYTVAELLLGQGDVALLRRSDYIRQPKPNGYRSLHLVLSMPVHVENALYHQPVEIQLRTTAMDLWANVDHMVQYKNGDDTADDIAARLARCAATASMLDRELQSIYRDSRRRSDGKNDFDK